ncbi:predicted protein [Scheffersomyces stipitis CBS 6054]|uniref:Uncharacterized protein n=1 Tax=Scheffersomyces stipitis (strain ATCC 58785 / CBS 6054 / NBRC 10063 / NRRL Y-11545) TaxID=322104 RepID=A3LYK6_PICST|nr:predicted protein [Scheffersomyces stipitis CBS 6054]ABN67991.2 predicted protein [Scheffersomyces stipitis CBS 6054]KAG2732482.1 hypothetical protein G9P44_004899 [Scheffersomyces stipitis]
MASAILGLITSILIIFGFSFVIEDTNTHGHPIYILELDDLVSAFDVANKTSDGGKYEIMVAALDTYTTNHSIVYGVIFDIEDSRDFVVTSLLEMLDKTRKLYSDRMPLYLSSQELDHKVRDGPSPRNSKRTAAIVVNSIRKAGSNVISVIWDRIISILDSPLADILFDHPKMNLLCFEMGRFLPEGSTFEDCKGSATGVAGVTGSECDHGTAFNLIEQGFRWVNAHIDDHQHDVAAVFSYSGGWSLCMKMVKSSSKLNKRDFDSDKMSFPKGFCDSAYGSRRWLKTPEMAPVPARFYDESPDNTSSIRALVHDEL